MNVFDAISIISYALIAWSYSCSNLRKLRYITIAACCIDLVVYAFIRESQPMWVQIIANLIFLATNLYHLFAGGTKVLAAPADHAAQHSVFEDARLGRDGHITYDRWRQAVEKLVHENNLPSELLDPPQMRAAYYCDETPQDYLHFQRQLTETK